MMRDLTKIIEMNEKIMKTIKGMEIGESLIVGKTNKGYDIELNCTTHSSIIGKYFSVVYQLESYLGKSHYNSFTGLIAEEVYDVIMKEL